MSAAKHPYKRSWASFRHPARRDGIVAVAFVLLPCVVALLLNWRDHRLDIATVAMLVSIALGLPVLWLTWAVFRDSRRASADGRELSLAEIADQLAVAVGAQWEAEANVWRLNDP